MGFVVPREQDFFTTLLSFACLSAWGQAPEELGAANLYYGANYSIMSMEPEIKESLLEKLKHAAEFPLPDSEQQKKLMVSLDKKTKARLYIASMELEKTQLHYVGLLGEMYQIFGLSIKEINKVIEDA